MAQRDPVIQCSRKQFKALVMVTLNDKNTEYIDARIYKISNSKDFLLYLLRHNRPGFIQVLHPSISAVMYKDVQIL